MSSFLYIVSCSIISFLISFYFLPKLISIALRFNITDVPDAHLKKHEKITPYLGGLGIFAGFFFAGILFLSFNQHIFLLLMGCALLVVIGLIDDIIALSPRNKLVGQILAVLFFLKAGLLVKSDLFSDFFSYIISFMWLLTVINAYNLIDVMDGLSSTVAMATAFSLLVFAVLQVNIPATILLFSFIGAVFAFFLFNKPPAKMYMGDAGSMFLGGFLASVSLLLDWHTPLNTGFLIPGILLGLPLMELISLIVIRTYHGIPFFNGSRHHFCHHLIDKNYSKQHILWISLLCCLYLFVVAFLFYTGNISFILLLLSGLAFLLFWLLFIIF